MLLEIAEGRGYKFDEEVPVGTRLRKRVDGAVQDTCSALGYWEAKDEDEADDLETEVKRKAAAGYPAFVMQALGMSPQ